MQGQPVLFRIQGCGVNMAVSLSRGVGWPSAAVVWAVRSVFHFGACITSPRRKKNVLETGLPREGLMSHTFCF